MQLSNEWNTLDSKMSELILAFQKEYPIKVGALARQLGIEVYASTMPANISGEIKEVDGIIQIKINRHDTKQRQRFTLAHEISHFLLHRHLLSKGIVDDVLYRSAQSSVIEAEANRLAADILMPPNLINRLMLDCVDMAHKEKKLEYVAQALDVSVVALKIRMGIMK
ncbi:ImmA/IrrE family metallo-endopeptidase [Acinetobacter baumannii]|uniref:ImmA/IrrE family metallo-endopeptidase n=1 Tax=Acinetobacter baumannii TaxID=470 RepID=UPI00235FD3D9|nr:ImmA/IrrE family metallo-endopeptidase [Acinetobacter baumannii]MDD1364481.1 ImmA/IrrE family metallo-endopeptidase [Acinetobacter baumannii]